MNNNENTNVPYVVHEGILTRLERTNRRLVYALIMTILLVFASNLAWIWYMSGFDIETYDYTQDGVGVNIIGSRNGVNYDVPEVGYQGNETEEEGEEEVGAP